MAKLTQKVPTLCRHGEEQWQATEVPGLAGPAVALARPGRRIVIRQRGAERPQAGGKTLLDLAGYRVTRRW